MKLPEPDTHCFDDDTRRDVWSYSAELVAEAMAAAVAADRERCASVLRYWLTGHAPAVGTYEARCLEHVLDGRPAATGWTERPSALPAGGD